MIGFSILGLFVLSLVLYSFSSRDGVTTFSIVGMIVCGLVLFIGTFVVGGTAVDARSDIEWSDPVKVEDWDVYGVNYIFELEDGTTETHTEVTTMPKSEESFIRHGVSYSDWGHWLPVRFENGNVVEFTPSKK